MKERFCFTWNPAILPNKEIVQLRQLNQAPLLRAVAREFVRIFSEKVCSDGWGKEELDTFVERIMVQQVHVKELPNICIGKRWPRGYKLRTRIRKAIEEKHVESVQSYTLDNLREHLNLVRSVFCEFGVLSTGAVFLPMSGNKFYQKTGEDSAISIPENFSGAHEDEFEFEAGEQVLEISCGLDEEAIMRLRPELFIFPPAELLEKELNEEED